MKYLKNISPCLVFFPVLLLTLTSFGQKSAKREPACLTDQTKDVRKDQIISEQCPKLTGPWIVYANRGKDFGKKYYVADEDLTKFLVYSGSGTRGLIIQNAKEVGWQPKSNYLFHFSADFTPDAMIHRKCVVLNSQGLVDSICQGLIEESRIPVFHSPTDATIMDYLPLYSIYFIYQSENKRYLLGRDYMFTPDDPFNSQIIGWVDANRVFSYDNRLCFEPNFTFGSVQKRRCDTIYGNAKVFSTAGELGDFLSNRKANIEPLWEEPNSFYYVQSKADGLKSGNLTMESMRHSMNRNCYPDSNCSLYFTNAEIKADFFRFPFLGVTRGDRMIFQVAATGKHVRNRQNLCDSLAANKNNLNVHFIIPDSFPNAYAVFFLSQLNTKYTSFTKKYNATYYPSREKYNSFLGNRQSGQKDYDILLDTLMNHTPCGNSPDGSNCLALLSRVLENEKFNPRETNLIVLINTSKSTFTQYDNFASISVKLAEKNCYLLTFDLANNTSFTETINDLVARATGLFSRNHDLEPIPFSRDQKGKCSVMTNYLLAASWCIDTTGLKGPQILEYIQASYDPVMTTITRVIRAACGAKADTISLSPNETLFRQGLETVMPGCMKNINSMRILQKGYTRLKYRDSKSSNDNIWQAEVLMTEGELTDLTTAIDGLTIDQTSTNVCDRVCELWQTLIRRFIGEEMIISNSYLDLTMNQVLDIIIGARFGYSFSGEIKRCTIRQICECQENVIEAALEYKHELNSKNQRLKGILHRTAFENLGEHDKSKKIKYYWVPVSALP